MVVLAQEEARALKHDYIGTEHLLLGLLREEEGLAAKALGSLGVKLEDVREQIEPGIRDASPRVITQTERAKEVLELALREALSLGHNYIGTEHILLGLLREEEGLAARVLSLDITVERVRARVFHLLSGPKKGLSGPEEKDRAFLAGFKSAPQYKTNENVRASSLTIAQALVTLAKDHLGTYTYDNGYERIVVERDTSMGINAQFFTCKT